MNTVKFIKKLLRLKGLIVTYFWFKIRIKELHLQVKPHKNGCRCPECGRRGKIIQILKARQWRDVCVCGWTVLFHYCPKEIYCTTHGRIQEEIPWAAHMARITYRFEYLCLVYSQLMTQKAAAEILHIPSSTLSDILHRTITRIREGHKIRGLKSIGIDEISYLKKHKYVTIVYDLERSCVVWVGKGKDRKTIDKFFNEELSPYQKKQIKWASCDMSETYMGAIKDHCPSAKLVLDRFHIVKKLNEALDEVRKQQWRKASMDERKALKGLRWLLFRHPDNRSEEDKVLLKQLKKGNNRIYRACILKDEFNLFWDFEDTQEAKVFLKRWGTSALKSRLEPIRNFVQTIRKYSDHIITFINSRLTNAIAEGLNRIIKIVKNRASGFRSIPAFIDLIYLTVGDVDIPNSILAKFHTL